MEKIRLKIHEFFNNQCKKMIINKKVSLKWFKICSFFEYKLRNKIISRHKKSKTIQ